MSHLTKYNSAQYSPDSDKNNTKTIKVEPYILIILHKLEESFGFYDVQSSQKIDVIKTRPYPHEICLDTGRSKIYIAEMGVRGIESLGPGGHTISVFDVRTRQLVSLIDTGKYDRPHGITIAGDRLYVTSESTKHLLVFNIIDENLLNAIYLDQKCAHMVTTSPDGNNAYTANILSNTITAIDTNTLTVLHHIDVPERPEGMVFSPDGNLIYCVCREAGCVAIIDRRTAEMIDRIDTGKGPVRIAISPDGSTLYIPLFHSASVQFANTHNRKVFNTLNVGPHPAGICISPDGKLIFISCEEENRVYIISSENGEILNRIETGAGADAMVCLHKSETH